MIKHSWVLLQIRWGCERTKEVCLTDLNIKTRSSICRSKMKSLAAILVGPFQSMKFQWGVLFSLMIVGILCQGRDWIIMQLLSTKNQVNVISLAAILGGRVQAEAMASNIWLQKQQNDWSNLNLEITGSSLYSVSGNGIFVIGMTRLGQLNEVP